MAELPKIKKMYVEAEADAIHWRKKYREVQQIRAAERTAAQKTAEELEQAEQREKGLREAILSALASYPENKHLHSLLERALLAVPEPTEPCHWQGGVVVHAQDCPLAEPAPPERCLVCGWTGTHSASCPLAEPTEPPPEEQP